MTASSLIKKRWPLELTTVSYTSIHEILQFGDFVGHRFPVFSEGFLELVSEQVAFRVHLYKNTIMFNKQLL